MGESVELQDEAMRRLCSPLILPSETQKIAVGQVELPRAKRLLFSRHHFPLT